ncbi:hypothetical protein J3459_016277 [Metarhizium acridum]|nr:hypothetical protein J3459_016928 [Metarhizium acridum]KAG8411774.1 hypothetical protein J3459_016277 [Metarhizium acridum]
MSAITSLSRPLNASEQNGDEAVVFIGLFREIKYGVEPDIIWRPELAGSIDAAKACYYERCYMGFFPSPRYKPPDVTFRSKNEIFLLPRIESCRPFEFPNALLRSHSHIHTQQ